jgi:hypothetical protein
VSKNSDAIPHCPTPKSSIEFALTVPSSDYPHPDSTNDPIGRFERTFEGLGEGDRELFYSKNFEQMMGERVLALAHA